MTHHIDPIPMPKATAFHLQCRHHPPTAGGADRAQYWTEIGGQRGARFRTDKDGRRNHPDGRETIEAINLDVSSSARCGMESEPNL